MNRRMNERSSSLTDTYQTQQFIDDEQPVAHELRASEGGEGGWYIRPSLSIWSIKSDESKESPQIGTNKVRQQDGQSGKRILPNPR